MLVRQKMKKKKVVTLIFVLVVIFGITAYVLMNSFGISIGGDSQKSPTKKVVAGLLIVPSLNTEFEDDFLKKEPYTNLEKHGQWPLKNIKEGRDNPFLELLYLIPSQR